MWAEGICQPRLRQLGRQAKTTIIVLRNKIAVFIINTHMTIEQGVAVAAVATQIDLHG